MQIHWREPLDWNRVKSNARALARIRPWWLFCGASAAVLLAGCLFVHVVHLAYVLQQTFVGAESFSESLNDILISAGCCVFLLTMPLCFLVLLILQQREQSSSLLWMEQCNWMVDRLDIGRRCFVWLVFAVWIWTVYFWHDVVKERVWRTFPELGLMVGIIVAWWIEAFVWKRLLGKGAGRKYETLVEGLAPRKMFALSIPYVLTLIFNPALVADALWRMSFDLKTICCLTAVWQLVWTVAVYSTGRLFRRENT